MLATFTHITNDYNKCSQDTSLIDQGCVFLSMNTYQGREHIGKGRLDQPICKCCAVIKLELAAIYPSVYQNNKYRVNILFSSDYPFRPPKVIFKTPIDHINVCDVTGLVTHEFLRSGWAPFGFRILIVELLQLFTEPRPQDLIY